MSNVDKNDLVIINLDRPRELRFGHKALKRLTAITGKGLDKIEEGDFDMEDIEKIMYCGLLSDAREHGETLELSQMEDLLDQAKPYSQVMEKMQEAFGVAFGSLGNDQAPTKPAQK